MARLQLLLGFATVALTVFCLVDAIRTPEDEVRHLPKTMWVLMVLLFPLLGSVAWLIAGRPKRQPPPRGTREPYPPPAPHRDGPGRAAPTESITEEEFRRRLRDRAEQQRRGSPTDPPAGP